MKFNRFSNAQVHNHNHVQSHGSMLAYKQLSESHLGESNINGSREDLAMNSADMGDHAFMSKHSGTTSVTSNIKNRSKTVSRGLNNSDGY